MPSTRWPNGSTRAWRVQRERILERDGRTCQHCGKRGSKNRKLHVHHVRRGNRLVVPDSWLETICHSCHYLTHQQERAAGKPRKKSKPTTRR